MNLQSAFSQAIANNLNADFSSCTDLVHVMSKPKRNKRQAKLKKPASNDYRTRDNLGAALGTKTATFNACLTLEGKTMKQLMNECQSTNTYYEHCADLVAEGLVIKEGKMFRLASDKERAERHS